MKKLFLILTVALSSAASAATVGITSGTPAQTILTSNGQFISTSAWVRVGFFRNLNTTGVSDPTPASLLAIENNFVPLGESTSPAGYGTPAANTIAVNNTTHSIGGGINDITFGTGPANTQAAGALPRGTRLFLLIYDNRLAPTELGVFSADTGWNVPVSSLVNTANLTLTNVNTAGEVFRGSLGAGSLILAPIPEPSTGLIALLAGLGLVARRRR